MVTTLPGGRPARSIGPDVIRWAERWLRHPRGLGTRLVLTQEQRRFLMWWYAVEPDGSWTFRRGIVRRSKGWGKDPLAAVVALVEMLGPSRPVPDAGRALGWSGAHEPAPEVYVAATTRAQCANTTKFLRPGLLPGRDLVALHDFRWSVSGLCRALTADGAPAEIQPLSSNWTSFEGGRPTAVLAGETQHWHAGNQGGEMAAVIRRNLGKIPGGHARMLASTNAHEPGRGSVAEADHAAWVQQRRVGGGDILLDSREVALPDGFDVRDPRQTVPAIKAVYGDADWMTGDASARRAAEDARDPARSEADVLRFTFNRITSGAGRWMSPSVWEACEDDRAPPGRGEDVAVGFDGSRTMDATALVCTEMATGWQWLAAVWERDLSADGWEVPAGEVHAAVESVFSHWRVIRMYADPSWWEDDVAAWQGRWPAVLAFEMRGAASRIKVARAVTAYHGAVTRGEAAHGGPNLEALDRHVLAAVRRPVQATLDDDERLHTVGKASRHSAAWIDAAVAAVLSWQARTDALAAGWRPRPRLRAVGPASARRLAEAAG